MEYYDFLNEKSLNSIEHGFDADESLFYHGIKDHQRVSIIWACKKGRSALFFDTGLGKTLSQLEWSKQVNIHTKKPVLIVAPLAVTQQTKRESEKFGIDTKIAESKDDVKNGIYITNYEKLHKFDCSVFSGVVLDESSILKGLFGKLRKQITESFINTPYKLSCTATPSPNDFMEFGTQSEFLNVMSQTEMLAMFFIHDGGEASKWRMKGHGKVKFWEWLATWSIYISSPSDLGFDGKEYELNDIEYHEHIINTTPETGELFSKPAQGLLDRNRARRDTVEKRCKLVAELVNNFNDNCVVWCNLNDESELLHKLINDSVEIKGSTDKDKKVNAMLDFADNKIKCLITKPKLAGFGMNWQSTNKCVFVGLSDSFEQYYQAIRRQWRFGQDKTVHVHIVSADTEGAVVENIKRKESQHKITAKEMINHMKKITIENVTKTKQDKTDYIPDVEFLLPSWI